MRLLTWSYDAHLGKWLPVSGKPPSRARIQKDKDHFFTASGRVKILTLSDPFNR